MHLFALMFALIASGFVIGGVRALLIPVRGGGAMPIGPIADAVLLFFLALVFALAAGVFFLL